VELARARKGEPVINAFLDGLPIERKDLRALRDQVVRDKAVLYEFMKEMMVPWEPGDGPDTHNERLKALLERLKQ
jgi:hypothetical protein